jgi:hypothetical protein
MTHFDLYDTAGEVRHVTADCTEDQMRILLSMFKTECIVEQKVYQYNHFVNWLKKYHQISITYEPLKRVRVDM